jgi:hypothetical protein
LTQPGPVPKILGLSAGPTRVACQNFHREIGPPYGGPVLL